MRVKVVRDREHNASTPARASAAAGPDHGRIPPVAAHTACITAGCPPEAGPPFWRVAAKRSSSRFRTALAPELEWGCRGGTGRGKAGQGRWVVPRSAPRVPSRHDEDMAASEADPLALLRELDDPDWPEWYGCTRPGAAAPALTPRTRPGTPPPLREIGAAYTALRQAGGTRWSPTSRGSSGLTPAFRRTSADSRRTPTPTRRRRRAPSTRPAVTDTSFIVLFRFTNTTRMATSAESSSCGTSRTTVAPAPNTADPSSTCSTAKHSAASSTPARTSRTAPRLRADRPLGATGAARRPGQRQAYGSLWGRADGANARVLAQRPGRCPLSGRSPSRASWWRRRSGPRRP